MTPDKDALRGIMGRTRLQEDTPASGAELRRFFDGVGSLLIKENAIAEVKPEELGRFFCEAKRWLELAEQQDLKVASDFNVFDLIKPDENRLSDILALLLEPRGAHGQGDLFLRLLFQQLGLGSDVGLTTAATVQREAPTHGIEKYRRRMDVFVEAGVLVAIENKVDSADQKDQAKHYLEHLRYCSRRGGKSVLIYLTPNGRRPKSLKRASFEEAKARGELRCWSYQMELRAWLENCRRDCEAPRICDFLSDFISHIKSQLKREPESNDEADPDEN